MNPWLILVGVLALIGSYAFGRNDGYEYAQAEHRKIELSQEAARKSALQAAAAEIAKIDVKNVTIQAKAHEIEQLTRKKDYAAAFEANGELMTASQNLYAWLWDNMSEAEKKRIIA